MTGFVALCAIVCLDVFFLALTVSVLAVSMALGLSRLLPFRARRLQSPDLLFSIRMLPWALSGILAVGFALPAFLLLEPRSTAEAPSTFLLVTAALALIVISVLLFRLGSSLVATTASSRRWLKAAQPIDLDLSIPIFRAQTPGPLLAVVGIFRPRIFVAERALMVLSHQELRAAVAHEQSHVQSFDNLKRLLLNLTRLPDWLGPLESLHRAWADAAEIRADEQTLAHHIPASDLASAVVKVGRLHADIPSHRTVAVSHLVSTNEPSILARRIAFLQYSLSTPKGIATIPGKRPLIHFRPSIFLIFAAYLLLAPFLLPVAQAAIERLFK